MPVVQMFLLGFIVFVTITIFYFVPVGMWIQGIVSLGVGRIRIIDLIRMRLRKISPRLVTDGVINVDGIDGLRAIFNTFLICVGFLLKSQTRDEKPL